MRQLKQMGVWENKTPEILLQDTTKEIMKM